MGRWSWLGPVFGSWVGVWVMVGSNVWVMVGLWLKWVVGRRRSPVFRFGEVGSGVSHGLSLISHHGSASWVWIGGLGSIDGGFETMDLLIIGSSDGGFGDDFFLMGLLRWVSNRRRGLLISGLGLLIGGLGGGCGGRCWLQPV